MSSVDEKLLTQGEDSADRAGDIREAKKSSQRDEPINIEQEDQDNYFKFRQKKQAEKNRKFSKKKLLTENLSPISPLAISLAQLLRQSWILLIKSFGLTLIWINIHVLGNMVFGPKVFCNLGEEWFMRSGVANNPQKKKQIKEAGKKIGLLEKMGCACLNLLFLLVLIIFLALISLPLQILGDPVGFVREVGSAVLGWIWDGVSGIFTTEVSD